MTDEYTLKKLKEFKSCETDEEIINLIDKIYLNGFQDSQNSED